MMEGNRLRSSNRSRRTGVRAAKHCLTVVCLVAGVLVLADSRGRADIAFTGVNVITMDDEQVLYGRTVFIEAGRIARIEQDDEGEIPAGTRVIEADGKYLMPGLAEMHAHIPGGNADPQYREDVLFLYLANGVTLARGMLGDPVHLEVRSRLARGELLGPRLVTAGPGIRRGNAGSPAAAVRTVREQAEAGYDFLKIFGGFSIETYEAFTEAARASGMPFAGHVDGNAGVLRALRSGYASIDHFDAYMPALVDPDETVGISGGFFGYRLAPFVEPGRMARMAERTRLAGTWNVPTESIIRSAFVIDLETVRETRPEFRYLPPEVVEGWFRWVSDFRARDDFDLEAGRRFIDVRLKLINALHEAGAGLLLGSDAPQWFNVPGFSIRYEMRHMEEAGLSPYEVLRTGTVNPAIYLGEKDVFGRVAEGLRADLILLDGNPLDDLDNIGSIAGVVRHGHWISRGEINRRLEAIAGRYENP